MKGFIWRDVDALIDMLVACTRRETIYLPMQTEIMTARMFLAALVLCAFCSWVKSAHLPRFFWCRKKWHWPSTGPLFSITRIRRAARGHVVRTEVLLPTYGRCLMLILEQRHCAVTMLEKASRQRIRLWLWTREWHELWQPAMRWKRRWGCNIWARARQWTAFYG